MILEGETKAGQKKPWKKEQQKLWQIMESYAGFAKNEVKLGK